jgi:hypothetical protein
MLDTEMIKAYTFDSCDAGKDGRQGEAYYGCGRFLGYVAAGLDDEDESRHVHGLYRCEPWGQLVFT